MAIYILDTVEPCQLKRLWWPMAISGKIASDDDSLLTLLAVKKTE